MLTYTCILTHTHTHTHIDTTQSHTHVHTYTHTHIHKFLNWFIGGCRTLEWMCCTHTHTHTHRIESDKSLMSSPHTSPLLTIPSNVTDEGSLFPQLTPTSLLPLQPFDHALFICSDLGKDLEHQQQGWQLQHQHCAGTGHLLGNRDTLQFFVSSLMMIHNMFQYTHASTHLV